MGNYIADFGHLGLADLEQVGSKNAYHGEMLQQLSVAGVNVPPGFATTAAAYRDFLSQSGLDNRIEKLLDNLDVEDMHLLSEAGATIRQWILETPLQPQLDQQIGEALVSLPGLGSNVPVAVRSSAIAEELPEASFAGQQETYLNIAGLENVKLAIKQVFASLFNDRSIAYRVHRCIPHKDVALSAGIQRMVRSETGSSGVMYTLDTESGFRNLIFINAVYGLAEPVIQGQVNPDEFYVSKSILIAKRPAVLSRNLGRKSIKMIHTDQHLVGESVTTIKSSAEERASFCLNDSEVLRLAELGLDIENHFGSPMEIEWAKDGDDGQLYILQARPEQAKNTSESYSNEGNSNGSSSRVVERYLLKETGRVLTEGRSVGQRIGSGPVRVIRDREELNGIRPGDVMVTDMTDPEWEPVMRRLSGIVTNRGGRTCHAAIIARELGIPAIVGCGDATKYLKEGELVTVSCADGDVGVCYQGRLDFEHHSSRVDAMPKLPFKMMMNIANPDRAYDFQSLPNEGVGLARLEFIITRMIGVHPKALIHHQEQPPEIKRAIDLRIAGYRSPEHFYIEKLVEGVSTLAVAFADKPVIVRLSDFKSNEYSSLIGGRQYELNEENPMLGFRGASRYISESFRECFELECRAMKKVRDEMGLTNVQLMVPFVRTLGEAKQVVELLELNGLKRGENGLKLIMMCELPSNALLADQFLEQFDGFSIGSNDLTQLTLGLDRDSGVVAHLFDERDEAVKALLALAIQACKRAGKYVGICGQGPSDYPDFASWLVEQGIDSLSLNPDSVLDTWFFLAQHKSEIKSVNVQNDQG
ncbi:phosphoenolpyruvate synthase [Motiliproteus sp. MSK22-1]|uniref:phosphoenolpyruvate synthase n=1 Tax=Motiliproteus sp. MSK22-1 TaxID=1897630 RepID=UPI0009780A80|nr:phosphoenolpyruvate synthase [Motiliproteus sp. MSK22-1]OMH32616.1 phosphoenolpyruvate synthase [Motiliproteus sp. MSK22-1]